MKQAFLQAGVILVLAAAGGLATYAFHPTRPALYLRNEPLGLYEVTLEGIAERWPGENVIWVDARSRAEFEKKHFPGAKLLNEAEWVERLIELDAEGLLADPEQVMVVYCAGHACEASRKIAEKLRQMVGLENSFYLRGGWKALKEFQGTTAEP